MNATGIHENPDSREKARERIRPVTKSSRRWRAFLRWTWTPWSKRVNEFKSRSSLLQAAGVSLWSYHLRSEDSFWCKSSYPQKEITCLVLLKSFTLVVVHATLVLWSTKASTIGRRRIFCSDQPHLYVLVCWETQERVEAYMLSEKFMR